MLSDSRKGSKTSSALPTLGLRPGRMALLARDGTMSCAEQSAGASKRFANSISVVCFFFTRTRSTLVKEPLPYGGHRPWRRCLPTWSRHRVVHTLCSRLQLLSSSPHEKSKKGLRPCCKRRELPRPLQSARRCLRGPTCGQANGRLAMRHKRALTVQPHVAAKGSPQMDPIQISCPFVFFYKAGLRKSQALGAS